MTKKTSPEDAKVDEGSSESEPLIEIIDSEQVDVEAQESVEDTDVVEPEETLPLGETVVQKKTGLPVLMGGAVAAVLGFGVAQFVPDGWPLAGADTSEIEAEIAAQSKELSDLKQMFETQETVLSGKVDDATLAADIAAASQARAQEAAGIAADLDLLRTNVEELSQRLSDVEKRPISSNEASDAAVEAYERELTAMRETLAAQKTQIETVAKDAEAKISEAKSQAEDLRAGAAETANSALMSSGISRINSAIEGGGAFEAALVDLTKATGKEPSAPLQAAAVSGIATLADLRESFPNAARDALSAVAVETTDQSAIDRVGAFLRNQTGARSLKPREGSDPDAILSRAEALVGDGKLNEALVEISGLPTVSQEAMADWVGSATYRLETKAAIQTFVSSISEN